MGQSEKNKGAENDNGDYEVDDRSITYIAN